MIKDTITKQIGEAMKAHDEIRLSTLRLLSSALNYEFIAKQHPLSEEEELLVVKKEAKKRKDAIEALQQAQGKPTSSSQESLGDKLKQEEKELEILKEFLPAEMSREELERLVKEAIKKTGATELKDIGKVIGLVVGQAQGRADGSLVASLVRKQMKLA